MDNNLKNQVVLLVKMKYSPDLFFTKIDRFGDAQGNIPVNSNNPDFLKFEKNGIDLEKYFERVLTRINDSTNFVFFLVPADKLYDSIQILEEAIKNKDDKFIKKHSIDAESFLNQRRKMRMQVQSQQQNQKSETQPNFQNSFKSQKAKGKKL